MIAVKVLNPQKVKILTINYLLFLNIEIELIS